jgi:hypothetical protein
MLLASWQLQHRCGTLHWWLADHYVKFYLNTQHAYCILNERYPHNLHSMHLLLFVSAWNISSSRYSAWQNFTKQEILYDIFPLLTEHELLTSVTWDVRPSSWIHKYQCFKWTCCIYLQVSRLLWNTDTYPLNRTYHIPQECKIPVLCDIGWEVPNILKAHAFLVIALDCLIL